jgi:hypothetical protein
LLAGGCGKFDVADATTLQIARAGVMDGVMDGVLRRQ